MMGRKAVLKLILRYIGFQIARIIFLIFQSIAWCFQGIYCKRAARRRNVKYYESSAHILNIIRKFRFDPLVGPNSASDFMVTHNRFDHPECVLAKNVSLYDFTDTEALFVEADPDIEVWRSEYACFHKLAQFTTARKLISLPIRSARRIADDLGDPDAMLIFMANTTRCGSTLLAQIFEKSGQCVTLSEPHVLNTLSRHAFKGSQAQWESQAKTIIRLLCKPACSAYAFYFLKFPGITINIIPDMHDLFPRSRQLFMYRDGLPVCQSFIRARHEMPFAYVATSIANKFPEASQRFVTRGGYRQIFGKIPKEMRIFGIYAQATFFWAFFISEFVKYRHKGYEIGGVKYEDLVADKEFAVKQIFLFCGIGSEHCEKATVAFEKDSQENSPLSRKNLNKYKVKEITDKARNQCDKICAYYHVPVLGQPCVLPGTISRLQDPLGSMVGLDFEESYVPLGFRRNVSYTNSQFESISETESLQSFDVSTTPV